MERLGLQLLTRSELSNIKGGRWIQVNGDWVWIGDKVIDNGKDYDLKLKKPIY